MATERIIASVTIGGTAIMMLLVRRLQSGQLVYMNEFVSITGIGMELNTAQKLNEDAVLQSVRSVTAMLDIADREGADCILVSCTAMLQNASNFEFFRERIQKALRGIPLLVLSPEEEAELAFLGATSDQINFAPTVLIDLGGIASEIIFGIGNEIVHRASVKLGYMDLTQRFKLDHYFAYFARRRAHRYIDEQLHSMWPESREWIQKYRPLSLVSGAITTSFVGLSRGELVVNRSDVHNVDCTTEHLIELYRMVVRTLPGERRQLLGIERDRANMVPGALMILYTLLTYWNFPVFRLTADGIRTGLIRRFVLREDTEVTSDEAGQLQDIGSIGGAPL